MRQHVFLDSLAAMLLLTATASAQTHTITGTLKGLAGEDYSITGTATFNNNTWTITGDLKSTTPPQQCRTINAPNGSLTDSNGAVWTWGAPTSGGNWNTLRNGQTTAWQSEPQNFVAAIAMSLVDGAVFNRHLSGEWRRWSPSGWQRLSGPPAGC